MRDLLARFYNWARWRNIPAYQRQTHRKRKINTPLAKFIRRIQNKQKSKGDQK